MKKVLIIGVAPAVLVILLTILAVRYWPKETGRTVHLQTATGLTRGPQGVSDGYLINQMNKACTARLKTCGELIDRVQARDYEVILDGNFKGVKK